MERAAPAGAGSGGETGRGKKVSRAMMGQWNGRGVLLRGVVTLALLLTACAPGAPSGPPIRVGLVAPLSGASGASGEAIRRGMILAADELNAAGGVLGRPLAIVVRDLPNDPPAGVAATRELVQAEQVVAIFGGIWGTVVLEQVEALPGLQVPLIDAWASIPAITRNGQEPNWAFRVSANDDSADEFLARYTVEVMGVTRPGLIMTMTPWGDANVPGLTDSLGRMGVAPAGVERFDQGDVDMRRPIERLRAAGSDALLMVPDAGDGGAIVRAKIAVGWKAPVLSHWGISGGAFLERVGAENAEGILTLQTYSFFGPQSPKGQALLNAYHQRFGTRRVEEIPAQVGVAHGYDGLHLLAQAIRRAGSTDGPAVRDALEHLEPYDGVVKRYAPAFTPTNHDALHADDYLMAVWQGGRLVPAARPRIGP